MIAPNMHLLLILTIKFVNQLLIEIINVSVTELLVQVEKKLVLNIILKIKMFVQN